MIRLLAVVGAVLTLTGAPAQASTPPHLTWQHPANPDPFRGDVSGVDCVRPGWCMIVDQSGQAIRYHDGRWDRPVRIVEAAGLAGPQSLSCGSPTLCVALDAWGRVARYDGTRWTAPAEVQPGVDLETVSCPNSTFCLALGNRVVTWNGSRWRVAANPLPKRRRGTALSCTSAAFCVATFHAGPDAHSYAWMYTRSTWKYSARVAGIDTGDLSLSCVTHTFCMAVGDNVGYERWNGTRWSGGDIPTAGQVTSASVSCTSSRHCLLAGSLVHNESLEWDGHSWGRRAYFDVRPINDLVGVSCTGTGPTCLAVNVMGGVTWYANHAWHQTVVRDPGWGITESVGCGTTMCVAADTPGGYVRTSGAGWSRPARSITTANFGARGASSVSCTSDTFCLEVGRNGAVRRYDGRLWHYTAPAPVRGAVLSCLSPTWCAAADPYSGQVSVYTGSSWRRPVGSLPSAEGPWQFSCGSRTMCVAASSSAHVRIFNGTRWSAARSLGPNPSSASGLSCVSATFCLVGSGTDTWRFDGSTWHEIPISAVPMTISCVNATFCAEVDGAGVQLFDGTSWSPSTTLVQPDSLPYQQIDCASRTLCVVSSPGNRIEVGTA